MAEALSLKLNSWKGNDRPPSPTSPKNYKKRTKQKLYRRTKDAFTTLDRCSQAWTRPVMELLISVQDWKKTMKTGK
jgi:hypothetical protein